jgi:hypothetical protein
MTAPFAAEYYLQPTLTEASLGMENDRVLRIDPIDGNDVVEAWEDLVRDLNHFERRGHELVSMQDGFDPAFHRYRMMMEISLLNAFGSAVVARLGKQTENDSRTFRARGLAIKIG